MAELEMTRFEVAALLEVFQSELDRGWVPSRSDIEDALGALRSQHVVTAG